MEFSSRGVPRSRWFCETWDWFPATSVNTFGKERFVASEGRQHWVMNGLQRTSRWASLPGLAKTARPGAP